MKKKVKSNACELQCIVKLWRIMRLTFLILLVGLLQVSASVYSQQTKLSLSLEGVSLEDAFRKIEDNSNYIFFYNADQIKLNQKVDLDVENQNIEKIMTGLLQGKNLTFKLTDRRIVVYPEDSNFLFGEQQQIKLSGKVTDNSGYPLPGVTVVVKGTTNGTITNFDGVYSLSDVPSDATIQFSFVGMKMQEISVTGKTSINVIMEEDAIGIEEVVAVGYGTVKKSDLTGSLSQVKAENISAYPALGVSQALQGRAAGVNISATNGEPGATMKIRIRGATSINSSSSPLYVVDGFPGGTMPPPEDIESIEILKDASATAIYGSRGANGVILVTTKRGESGDTKIEINTSYSLQKEINRLDLLGPDDFIDYVTEAEPNVMSTTMVGPGTDWQDEVFRAGQIQNHNISLSGGSDLIKFYVSGIVYDHKGVVINSQYERYSITSNLDIKASEKFKVGVNLFANRYLHNGLVTQESFSSNDNPGIISTMFIAEPTLPIYDEDDNYTILWDGEGRNNPVAVAWERQNEEVQDQLQANISGEYMIFPKLKLRVSLGANVRSRREGNYVPTTLKEGLNVGGKGSISALRSTELMNENYLTYTKSFGEHDISVMGGYSYQSSREEYWGAAGNTYISDAFSFWNLNGSSNYQSPTSKMLETELVSYYGRFTYKLFDRYLLTFNARYDGSSRFAKNNKWAFFPSGAIAWNVAEESFMESVEQISQLKIRASYGITGNQAIPAYRSLAKMSSSILATDNSQVQNVVEPSAVANHNLTWESTVQTNIGFDLGLFNQRVSLVGDIYVKKTSDLLFQMPLPEYSGYSFMWRNIGEVENKGIELSLNTVNIDREFKWTTDLNFSINRNKVLKLPGGNDIFSNSRPGHITSIGNNNLLREGEPVGTLWGYIFDGLSQSEADLAMSYESVLGGEKFKDLDGDEVLTSKDRTKIMNPHPDFIYGINNTFKYKGFDLNIFLQGSQGNEIYSFTLQALESMTGHSNSTTEALKRWTPNNTNTDVPVANMSRGKRFSDKFVFDGSYLRVKNLAFGYNLPKSLLNSLGLGSARVYVSGQNLFTITSYRGFDPEVNYQSTGTTDSNKNIGLDYASYPNAKSYTIGLKLTF